jgi:hypothetical protein
MRYRPERLPPDIRGLVGAFDEGLNEALGEDLVASYVLGSAAAEEGRRGHAGDIDFFVVTRRALSKEQIGKLRLLHRRLARRYRFGDDLDGLYVTAQAFRSPKKLMGLGFDAEGRHRWAVDEMWATHRAHLHAGACLVLHGFEPDHELARASWTEIARELDKELARLRRDRRTHPVYSTLNLCRLMYSWKARECVISKRAAAHWAREALPGRWKPVVSSALRLYGGRGRPDDDDRLAENLAGFFRFAESWIARAKSSGRGPRDGT